MKKNLSIYALSTPWGTSGVSVIRVSGEHCKKILDTLCPLQEFKNRYACFAKIMDFEKKLIDKGVVIFFKGPNSFTGEDMIEFQIHGGPLIIKKLLFALQKIKNTRSAEPGEFIKRAFINKKIDLLEVEGTSSLIKAETESQLTVAQNLINGKLKSTCEEWRMRLTEISAMVDAIIEFSEEDESIERIKIFKFIKNLIIEFEKSIVASSFIKEINSGINVLIVGPPNAGKSTLFNLVCQEEKSIVTSVEGTTRDLIFSSLDIKGFKVNLIDSAGLRETSDKIERIGIKKIFLKSKTIDRFIIILSPDSLKKKNYKMLLKLLEFIKKKKVIIFYNKTELKSAFKQIERWERNVKAISKYPFKATSFANLEHKNKEYRKIIEFIFKNLIFKKESLNDDVLFSEVRQIEHISKALFHLKKTMDHKEAFELISEELRLAIKQIECISGNIDFEKKLDFIFNQFCIGK